MRCLRFFGLTILALGLAPWVSGCGDDGDTSDDAPDAAADDDGVDSDDDATEDDDATTDDDMTSGDDDATDDDVIGDDDIGDDDMSGDDDVSGDDDASGDDDTSGDDIDAGMDDDVLDGDAGLDGGAGATDDGGLEGAPDSGIIGQGDDGGTDAGLADSERVIACNEYCGAYLTNCETSDANTYDDEDDCNATCMGSDWPIGDQATSGSILCRAWHADLASGAPQPHCFHSAEVPAMGGCQ